VRFRRLADAAVDLNDVIKIDSFSYRIWTIFQNKFAYASYWRKLRQKRNRSSLLTKKKRKRWNSTTASLI
jgi:hypothetical protein